ncbi:MAG: hypothetical protein IPK83_18260 [Planctomycetes bacterium]|nr:hypothetical protein [Planctomycetota bacterium]
MGELAQLFSGRRFDVRRVLGGRVMEGCANAFGDERWYCESRCASNDECSAGSLRLGVFRVHPWGWRAAAFPFQTLEFLQSSQALGGSAGGASKSAWAEISEFQSPLSFVGERINHVTIWAYVGLLAIVAAGGAVCLKRGAVGPLLFILVLLAMSTQMRRNIAQFSLAAVPLAIVAIRTMAWFDVTSKLRRLAAIVFCVGCVAGTASAASGRAYFRAGASAASSASAITRRRLRARRWDGWPRTMNCSRSCLSIIFRRARR